MHLASQGTCTVQLAYRATPVHFHMSPTLNF